MNGKSAEPSASVLGSCLAELGWLSLGLVRPMYSLSFYRRAKARPAGLAAVFFLAFGVALALFATIGLLRVMLSARQPIGEAFVTGEFPEISIVDGRASIRGSEPFIVSDDEAGLIVLDTTGTYTSIDRTAYVRGLLLTDNEIHVLDNRQYRILPLSDLQELIGNPFVLNANTALQYWRSFTILFTIFSFLGLSLWNGIVWFMWLGMLAIFFWGFASLFQSGANFGEVLILGIYAYVPATYLQLMLGLAQISILGLRTLLLLGVWGFLMIRLLGSDEMSTPTPMI